jgi:hypothetical protein
MSISISTVEIEIPIIENLTYFSEKCFEILTLLLKSGTNRNRNSDVEIKIPISTCVTEIEILISTSKSKFPKIETSRFRQN